MNGLTLELQHDALDSSKSITDLLRKSLVVAKKLNISEFEKWCILELDGYENNPKDIPGYRNVHGELKAWNDVRGWIPVIIRDPEVSKKLMKREIGQPTAELENLVHSAETGSILSVNLPKETENILMESAPLPGLRPVLHVGESELIGILNAIRNMILNWSLKLEEDGIIGEGMSFSNNEKDIAASVNYNIINFKEAVSKPIIQQGVKNEGDITVYEFGNVEEIFAELKKLKEEIKKLKLNKMNRLEIDADVKTIESQLLSPNPKRSILKECLQSIKNSLTNAAGNALAFELIEQIVSLLG